jgi:3-dehydroquinate synthase
MKQRVVEEDPTEKGIRAYLNFGHTIGHAVEKLMNFQIHHGQCVSIGMAAALYLSMKKGYIKEEEYQRELAFIKGMNLPVFVEKPDFTAEDVLEATKSDKKRNGNRIKFVLIKPIGSALIDESLNDSDLLLGIQSIIKE